METALQQILATGVVGAIAVIFYFDGKDAKQKLSDTQELRVKDQKDNAIVFREIIDKQAESETKLTATVLQILEVVRVLAQK